MIFGRVDVKALPVQRFLDTYGISDLSKLEYGLALVLAGLARSLPTEPAETTTIVIPAEAFEDVCERGAWVELQEVDGKLVLRVTLK
jgi:hypothetical protein